MSDIKAGLLGRLPGGDGNGLAVHASEMAREPGRIRVGIVLFDADRIVEKTDDGNHEARARIRRWEVITDPGDAAAMQRILMREFERRTGQAVLPIELENDIEAAFADIEAAVDAPDNPAAEHVGADEGYADELRVMKQDLGVRPTLCGQCGIELHADAAGGWLDADGWPARDGHTHTPNETR